MKNILFLYLVNFLFPIIFYSGYTTNLWFNHFIISSFQIKFITLIAFTFFLISSTIYSNLIFTSKEIYDYIITKNFFFYWIVFLFFSNSLFTAIFNIEVLSTLIFTLHITSVFSNSTSYNSSNLNFSYLFQNSSPFNYLKSLLFFYWISLLSSLNLFLFLIVFYLNFFSFDWYFFEYIFFYTFFSESPYNFLAISFSWVVLLVSLFIKCGIAPFFIWKPTFFKGLSFHNIFLYIVFYYFFVFYFLLYLIIQSFNIFLIKFNFFLTFIVIAGLLILLGIITEASYIKTFLAVSSIINSLLILLSLNSLNSSIHFLI